MAGSSSSGERTAQGSGTFISDTSLLISTKNDWGT